MIEWEPNLITELAPDEVFVFGSNSTGFHGAGAAGYAMRGPSAATVNWRNDPWFKSAMGSLPGSQARKGLWAVYGVARGHQEGTQGESYAIETVVRPGAKRSVPRREICLQLIRCFEWAKKNCAKKLIVSPLGECLAGYSRSEMDEVWDFVVKNHGVPEGTRFVGRPADGGG